MGATERLRARTFAARFERLRRERAHQDAELVAMRQLHEVDAAGLIGAEQALASGEGADLRARFDALAREPAGWEAGVERHAGHRSFGALRA